MIKKYGILAALCMYSSVTFSMEYKKATPSAPQAQTVQWDANVLYAYLSGIFRSAGNSNNPTPKPSEILKSIQKAPQIAKLPDKHLSLMKTAQYIEHIISKEFDNLDSAFETKYAETTDKQTSWTWFIVHFEKAGICEPLSKHYNVTITKCSLAQILQSLK